MEFLHPAVEEEYERWKKTVGPEDPFQSDDTIGLHNVLAAFRNKGLSSET